MTPRGRRASTLSAVAVGAAVAGVAFIAVIVARSAATGTGGATLATDASVGRLAPSLHAVSTEGVRVDLATYAGRPVLVDFFASWCSECRSQATQLADMARAQGPSLALVSVAEGDTAAADAHFAARYGWRWPVVEDRDFLLAHDFDVPGVPTAVLVDGHGRIADVFHGAIQMQRLHDDLAKVTG